MVSLSLVSPPVGVLVPLGLAKGHAHVALDDFDELIDAYIGGAADHFERLTARQLLTATYALTLDRFPCGGIELPRPPLRRVVSVAYVDQAGVPRTLDPAAYVVTAPKGPNAARGWLRLAYEQQWPTVRGGPDAVTITFEAGYGTFDDFPKAVRVALLQIVAHSFANREAVHVSTNGQSAVLVPMSAQALMANYVSHSTQRLVA